jgi:hypothetical protein
VSEPSIGIADFGRDGRTPPQSLDGWIRARYQVRENEDDLPHLSRQSAQIPLDDNSVPPSVQNPIVEDPAASTVFPPALSTCADQSIVKQPPRAQSTSQSALSAAFKSTQAGHNVDDRYKGYLEDRLSTKA